MKTTLSLHEVASLHGAAQEILKSKLPPKGAYWLGRVAKALASAAERAETKRRDLVMTIAEDNGSGTFAVPAEKMKAFAEDLKKAWDEEVEVEVPTLRLEHFGESPIDGHLIARIERLIVEEPAGG